MGLFPLVNFINLFDQIFTCEIYVIVIEKCIILKKKASACISAGTCLYKTFSVVRILYASTINCHALCVSMLYYQFYNSHICNHD